MLLPNLFLHMWPGVGRHSQGLVLSASAKALCDTSVQYLIIQRNILITDSIVSFSSTPTGFYLIAKNLKGREEASV